VEVIANDVQNAWNGLIGLTEKLVIPDWGSLIALIPVGLAAIVVLFSAWQVRLWATAGPTRRGIAPRPPQPPPGIHAGGQSFAPVFTAIGAFLLFFGLIVRGVAMWLGIAALVTTLVYWLREAVHDYEAHVEATRVPVPTPGRASPPGLHVPVPSFQPILVSLAACVVFFGLVFGTPILLAGVILLIGALVGWLRDARREYVATETADRTGHLETGPTPHFPTRSLSVGVAVVAVAVLINAGALSGGSGATAIPSGGATASGGTAGSPAAGGSPAASGGAGGSPAASGGAGGSPAASGGAGGSPAASPVKADVTITAQGIAFVQTSVEAKAGTPFTIAFDNEDNGVTHNIDIKDASGASKFKGDIVSGVTTKVYQVPALTAGTYTFICDVHTNMTGTLTVK
jgi:plastocyanin